MENKTFTAVEWFIEQLIPKDQHEGIMDIIEEAKQMEEDQLFEFWNGGIDSTEEGGKSFDQFYEIYNK